MVESYSERYGGYAARLSYRIVHREASSSAANITH